MIGSPATESFSYLLGYDANTDGAENVSMLVTAFYITALIFMHGRWYIQADITPLGAAAAGGHVELVLKLLKWKADVNLQDMV